MVLFIFRSLYMVCLSSCFIGEIARWLWISGLVAAWLDMDWGIIRGHVLLLGSKI